MDTTMNPRTAGSRLVALGCLCAAIIVGIPCVAQDAAQGGASAKEGKPAAAKILTLDLGLGTWQASGNVAKLFQYASPSNGVHIRELTLQPGSFPYDGYAVLTLRGVAADDMRGDAEIGLNGARTRVWIYGLRNRFAENSPMVIPESNRKADGISVRILPAPDYSVTLNYGTENLDRYFEPPREALRRRVRFWNLDAFGSVGQGSLGVGVSDFRFYDRMLATPDTAFQSWHLTGLWSPAPEADLSGAVVGRTIERDGSGVGRSNEVALGGNVELGGVGLLSVRGQVEHMNWPLVESAQVTDRRMVESSINSRLGSMGLRVRWQYREVERVRAGGDYLDVPKLTNLSGRLSGRINDLLRVTLRGATERMWQRPQMMTTDTRSAVWDSKDDFEVRLDGTGDTIQGFAGWRFIRRGNTERGTNLTCGTASAGATWSLAPNLEVFGEISYETWRGRSEITAYPTLDNFMPDGRTTSLGLSYALGGGTYFWGGYTDAVTNNDNPLLLRDGNTHSRYLTLMLRHRFAAGEEISLSVAPWTYRDEADPRMNMTATTFVVSGRSRF
jgi:hypothetical protein